MVKRRSFNGANNLFKRNCRTNKTGENNLGSRIIINGKPDNIVDRMAYYNVKRLKNKFPRFKTPIFNRTLTQWFNDILDAGFVIEQINEPYPDNETVNNDPSLQDAQIVAYFLHIRCRK